VSNLQFDLSKRGEVTILTLSGKVIRGGEVILREAVDTILGQGARQIVIDLAEVPHIDSAGLGQLVSSYTYAQQRHAEIKLANLMGRVRDLLEITYLTGVFESYDSVDEAVAAFDENTGT